MIASLELDVVGLRSRASAVRDCCVDFDHRNADMYDQNLDILTYIVEVNYTPLKLASPTNLYRQDIRLY
jgi:hypothetical protein